MPVVQLDAETGEYVNSFASLRQAERSTGIGNSDISRAARSVIPTAGGYLWRRGTKWHATPTWLRLARERLERAVSNIDSVDLRPYR